MIEIYFYAFASVILVSAISLVGIFTLFLREEVLQRYTHLLVSLAIGALLGDAFIHLIPGSFSELNPHYVGLVIIGGMLLFFVLEKGLHWHHSHFITNEELDQEIKPSFLSAQAHSLGAMIIISDGLHNFLDGVIIGASYFVSIEVGIATTIAIILHEIPQEIGDFGVLVHVGYTRGKALLMNFLSALTSLAGASVALVLHEVALSTMTWVIPIAAGGFIYIAAVDLIPELQKVKRIRQSTLQLIMIIVGVAVMMLLALRE